VVGSLAVGGALVLVLRQSRYYLDGHLLVSAPLATHSQVATHCSMSLSD
jgi:hypothetical protein